MKHRETRFTYSTGLNLGHQVGRQQAGVSRCNLNLNLNLILTLILGFILNLSLTACSKTDTAIPNEAIYQKTVYGTLIPYQTADPELKIRFNGDVLADSLYYEKGDTAWTGFKTQNREFLTEVITPALSPYLEELSTLSQHEIINELALFTFNIYQAYFGQSFYRWGGDLFDLDDPQTRGRTSRKRYGLDCSGFVAAPYEMAVHFELIPDTRALFSWQGFKHFCEKTGFEDRGGLDGGGPTITGWTRGNSTSWEKRSSASKSEVPCHLMTCQNSNPETSPAGTVM